MYRQWHNNTKRNNTINKRMNDEIDSERKENVKHKCTKGT